MECISVPLTNDLSNYLLKLNRCFSSRLVTELPQLQTDSFHHIYCSDEPMTNASSSLYFKVKSTSSGESITHIWVFLINWVEGQVWTASLSALRLVRDLFA